MFISQPDRNQEIESLGRLFVGKEGNWCELKFYWHGLENFNYYSETIQINL